MLAWLHGSFPRTSLLTPLLTDMENMHTPYGAFALTLSSLQLKPNHDHTVPSIDLYIFYICGNWVSGKNAQAGKRRQGLSKLAGPYAVTV